MSEHAKREIANAPAVPAARLPEPADGRRHAALERRPQVQAERDYRGLLANRAESGPRPRQPGPTPSSRTALPTRLKPALQMKPALAERSAAGAAPGVIQRVWSKGEYPKKWDQLIDGVQWFLTAEDRMWYKIIGIVPDTYRKYEGEDKARTAEWWDILESQLKPVEERVAAYGQTKRDSLDKKETKAFEKDRGVEPLKGDAPTPVLATDKENVVEKTNWQWVADDLGRLSGDSSQLDDKRKNTKFINMFHVPHGGGEVDAVVMMENFRELARPFFASDAFFAQWLRVGNYQRLSELPTTFPRFAYRNNISNEKLAEILIRMTGEKDYVDIEIGGIAYRELAETDNVKSTASILSDYNKINALRGEQPSRISAMRIYRNGPAIRFEITKG
jgi:hypothetical protein